MFFRAYNFFPTTRLKWKPVELISGDFLASAAQLKVANIGVLPFFKLNKIPQLRLPLPLEKIKHIND
jgi:hypothetical protein